MFLFIIKQRIIFRDIPNFPNVLFIGIFYITYIGENKIKNKTSQNKINTISFNFSTFLGCVDACVYAHETICNG